MQLGSRLTLSTFILLAAGCSEPASPASPAVVPDAGTRGEDVCADPGFVPLRRLSRSAYSNSLSDLLGFPVDVSRLPDDDVGYGFNHIGEVLSVSAVHVEHYEAITAAAVAELLRTTAALRSWTYNAETVGSDVGGATRAGGWNMWSNGSMLIEQVLDAPGVYEFRTEAWAQQAGPELAKMDVLIDGVSQRIFDVAATEPGTVFSVRSGELSAGYHTFSVAFTNDYYDPDNPDPAQRDRNLLLAAFEIEGPFDAAVDSAMRARWVPCAASGGADEACVRASVAGFARAAWRRGVDADSVDRLVALAGRAVSGGGTWDEGLALAFQAVLLSPRFLYLVELDAAAEASRLSGFELATRLSYLLWNSLPDADLLARAEAGELDSDAGLAGVLSAMMADDRSSRLVDQFFGQWLNLRALEPLQPDYNVFPEWDDELRAAMRRETELVSAWAFGSNAGLDRLIDAAPVFINQRLADHYGTPFVGEPVPGAEGFVRAAEVPGRGGLLTQGSILTLTSFPNRTSPVRRGKWVLERLLCDAPPPPPPGVEGELDDVDQRADLRERLAQHRADPACAGCHESMDPIGLGMEGMDGIGRHLPDGIDTTGELPDGRSFDGVAELQSILAADPRLAACFVRHVYTYALARGPRTLDRCHLADLTADFSAGGLHLRDLFARVAASPSFTHRRLMLEGE
jgi:hypothetical protein